MTLLALAVAVVAAIAGVWWLAFMCAFFFVVFAVLEVLDARTIADRERTRRLLHEISQHPANERTRR